MKNQHDRFFKKTFGETENAKDFTAGILPEEIGCILDFETLTIENTDYVDKNLKEYFSDIVYHIQTKTNSSLKIPILLEHKSFPDNKLPVQILKYMVEIWLKDISDKNPPTPVIPIIIYHGKQEWKKPEFKNLFIDFPGEIKKFIPDLNLLFVDLSSYSDSQIKNQIFSISALKLGLLIMKNIFNQEKLTKNIENYFETMRTSLEDENSFNFLEAVINYIYKATEIDTKIIIQSISRVSEKGGKLAMTTAEKLKNEGMQQGAAQTMKKLVLQMDKSNISNDEISKITGIEIEVVKRIIQGKDFNISDSFFRE